MQSLRILLVEDDPLLAMLLGRILADVGHDVCATVATDTDAVTAAALHTPDLLIVDALLGAGSGISAVDQILRTGFVPHLFMSGDVLKVKKLRPDAVVLEKPFHEAALAQAIDRVLAAGVKG